jgi:hypothetical protein
VFPRKRRGIARFRRTRSSDVLAPGSKEMKTCLG